MHADDLVLQNTHLGVHGKTGFVVELVNVGHHENEGVLHVHQIREELVFVSYRDRHLSLQVAQLRLGVLKVYLDGLILIEGDHRFVVLGKQLLQVMILFPRILEHFGKV